MTKIDTIIFDMDGTIADLYGTKNWLPMLRTEQNIFNTLKPMVNMTAFNKTIEILSTHFDIRIITWLPMNATKEYKKICTNDKKQWIKAFCPSIKKVHAIQYGAKKHYIKNLSKNALLFDDNETVRNEWVASGRIATNEKYILNKLLQLGLDKLINSVTS